MCSPGSHEFDAVSDYDSIVAAIKGHSYMTSGGKLPSGKFDSLYRELYFLSLVKADKKLLVFTNEDLSPKRRTRPNRAVSDSKLNSGRPCVSKGRTKTFSETFTL